MEISTPPVGIESVNQERILLFSAQLEIFSEKDKKGKKGPCKIRAFPMPLYLLWVVVACFQEPLVL